LTAVASAQLPELSIPSAARPLRAGPLNRSALVTTALGIVLVGIVSTIELPYMPAIFGALAVLIAMAIAPVVGLYLVLVAVAFSPTFGIEDAAFSVSAFEPLMMLVILFWIVQGAVRREISLPHEGLLGAMILLLAVLFLAGGGATSYPLALKETFKWVLLVLAYVYTRMTIRTDRAARGLLLALLLTGSAEAILGAAQFFVPIGPPGFAVGPFIRAHGMFGQPNPFAGYLGTIFPIALAMTLIPHPGRFRTIAAICTALIGLGIFLSLSRGAWLGLTISLGVMATAWSVKARRLVIPLAACIVLVVALAMAGLLPPNIAARITSATDNFGVFDVRTVQLTSENFAIVERMAHWQVGWWMFRDYPFLGVGPGNYPAVYEQYYIPPWREPLGHAHNYFLNMAAEAGMPGLLALILVLAMAFRSLSRRIVTIDRFLANTAANRPTDDDTAKEIGLDPAWSLPLSRALALGLIGSLTLVSIHSMFDNLLVHGVGIQIGVLLGLVGGVSNR
jgi:putative inorganic carbon (HCO3(-)) transporter